MEVELATRGQSDSPNWFAHRQNKITASVVKDVFSHINNYNNNNHNKRNNLQGS